MKHIRNEIKVFYESSAVYMNVVVQDYIDEMDQHGVLAKPIQTAICEFNENLVQSILFALFKNDK